MTPSEIATVLQDVWAHRRDGDYVTARSLLVQAHEACDEYDFENLGRVFHIYMQFEADHENFEKAMEFSAQSVAYYERSANRDKIAHARRHLADLQYHLKKWNQAEESYRQVIELYRSHSQTSDGDLANALRGFALLLKERGAIEEAKRVWQETKELYQALGIQAGVDEANQNLASLN